MSGLALPFGTAEGPAAVAVGRAENRSSVVSAGRRVDMPQLCRRWLTAATAGKATHSTGRRCPRQGRSWPPSSLVITELRPLTGARRDLGSSMFAMTSFHNRTLTCHSGPDAYLRPLSTVLPCDLGAAARGADRALAAPGSKGTAVNSFGCGTGRRHFSNCRRTGQPLRWIRTGRPWCGNRPPCCRDRRA